MKAYYHKFQSTGLRQRQFSVSCDEGDDGVTIYVKTAGHFYTTNTSPIPEMQNIADRHDEKHEKESTIPKKMKKKKKTTSKKSKNSKKKTDLQWQNFDDKTLKHLGKKYAEHKSGYEFGIKYDFWEFFWKREWNKIVLNSLDLSTENKELVPLNATVSEGAGSETEVYSKNDEK